ncbi:MAG TPA: DMT family transporter [Streptosporangiaceae bacterium]|nr:DMT family transporter [Streptosporangiaceae bacterium]
MSAGPLAGIGLALVATTSYNIGLILEKRALGRMPALDIRHAIRVLFSLLANASWLGGFALMLTGLACQTIVLSFEPVSLVQPVLASGIALVIVLSRVVLRERLGGAESWCVAAMAVCVVLLALSTGGASSQAGHDVSGIAMTAVAVPSMLAGLAIATKPLRGRPFGRHRAPVSGICYGLGTGLLYGVASLGIKGLSGVLVHNHAASGVVTGLLASPYLYLFGGCAVTAMLLFQVALQSCRASIVVPVSSVTSTLYFLVAGTWLFHEHLPASPDKLGLRLTGIIAAGLVLVALARQVPSGSPDYTPAPRSESWR